MWHIFCRFLFLTFCVYFSVIKLIASESNFWAPPKKNTHNLLKCLILLSHAFTQFICSISQYFLKYSCWHILLSIMSSIIITQATCLEVLISYKAIDMKFYYYFQFLLHFLFLWICLFIVMSGVTGIVKILSSSRLESQIVMTLTWMDYKLVGNFMVCKLLGWNENLNLNWSFWFLLWNWIFGYLK